MHSSAKRPKPYEVKDLFYSTDVWACRQGHRLPSFSIELTIEGIDKWLFGPGLPAAYPPRVRNWIIRQLDTVPRVTDEDHRALRVTLHNSGRPPLVFGHFNIRSNAGAGLVKGLFAYHNRLLREMEREQKRQQRERGRIWLLGELAGLAMGQFVPSPKPRKRAR